MNIPRSGPGTFSSQPAKANQKPADGNNCVNFQEVPIPLPPAGSVSKRDLDLMKENQQHLRESNAEVCRLLQQK